MIGLCWWSFFLHFSQKHYMHTDRQTNWRRDEGTDTRSYKDARTHLKQKQDPKVNEASSSVKPKSGSVQFFRFRSRFSFHLLEIHRFRFRLRFRFQSFLIALASTSIHFSSLLPHRLASKGAAFTSASTSLENIHAHEMFKQSNSKMALRNLIESFNLMIWNLTI